MKHKFLTVTLVVLVCIGTASAQFGGIVYDPTNYANAVLRYQQLIQQLAQLRQTYQQILNQYNLALAMSQNLRNMPARYRAQFSQWRNGSALDAYGNTAGWINIVNTGAIADGYQQATTQLVPYNAGYLASMDLGELARVKSQYATVELADGANQTAMGAIGSIRGNALTLQAQLENLENDSFSNDPDLNSEVSVLNKINAANMLTLRSVQDSNKLLASLLEVQTVLAKQQREGTTNAINADIQRQAGMTANIAQVTGTLSDSLLNFRMP